MESTLNHQKESVVKPRSRNLKNKKKDEKVAIKPQQTKPKMKGKKLHALLNKSVYRYYFQRMKPKFQRLLEANELLKEELERKQRDMTELCSEIHHLLERLKPYVSTNNISSSDSETDATFNHVKRKGKVSKVASKPRLPENNIKKNNKLKNQTKVQKKATREKLKDPPANGPGTFKRVNIIEVTETNLNVGTIEKSKIVKKSNSPVCSDISQFINHQNQKIFDDFMMLESPYSIFNLKRNDGFDSINDHESCNGSLNIIPSLKEPLENMNNTNNLDRRDSIELSSEASSGDSLVATNPNITFLRQMKNQLSFFIPSEVDHQLVSINPDKLPTTLPDDIFSES